MMRSLLWLSSLLLLVSAATASTTDSSSSSNLRFLEDVAGYQYLNDLSGYYTKYTSCFKVKIQENNDDQVEGNSYFYNGKYYAQYNHYASFKLCNGDASCGNCDDGTGYITPLNDYLESTIEFLQEYCGACANYCNRRKLEEEANADEMNGDCGSCTSQCSLINNGNGNGLNEANYLDCQQADVDENGVQYYQAPSCEDGTIVMGLYYDEDCTVKSNAQPESDFDYDTFETIMTICTECYGNDEVCDDLYQDSTHCYGNSVMMGGDDDGGNVCKRYAEAVREVQYAKRRKKWNFRGLLLICFILVAVLGFLAHTYYIRHRNRDLEKEKPLSKYDHGESGPPKENPDNVTAPEVTMT